MNLLQQYNQFLQNPNGMLSQMGIPQNLNSPQSIMQYLMDTGRVTQADYNRARMMAQQLQGTPPKQA